MIAGRHASFFLEAMPMISVSDMETLSELQMESKGAGYSELVRWAYHTALVTVRYEYAGMQLVMLSSRPENGIYLFRQYRLDIPWHRHAHKPRHCPVSVHLDISTYGMFENLCWVTDTASVGDPQRLVNDVTAAVMTLFAELCRDLQDDWGRLMVDCEGDFSPIQLKDFAP